MICTSLLVVGCLAAGVDAEIAGRLQSQSHAQFHQHSNVKNKNHSISFFEEARRDVQSAGGLQLSISGTCPNPQRSFTTVFTRAGIAGNLKPYYKARDTALYLYFDGDCDGPSSGAKTPQGLWMISDSEPRPFATVDLDGDGACRSVFKKDGSLPPQK